MEQPYSMGALDPRNPVGLRAVELMRPALQNPPIPWEEVLAFSHEELNRRACAWLNERSYDVHTLFWNGAPENSYIEVSWNTEEDIYNGTTNESLFSHSMVMARLLEDAVCEFGPRADYEAEIANFSFTLPDVLYVNALFKTLCAVKVFGEVSA